MTRHWLKDQIALTTAKGSRLDARIAALPKGAEVEVIGIRAHVIQYHRSRLDSGAMVAILSMSGVGVGPDDEAQRFSAATVSPG